MAARRDFMRCIRCQRRAVYDAALPALRPLACEIHALVKRFEFFYCAGQGNAIAQFGAFAVVGLSAFLTSWIATLS